MFKYVKHLLRANKYEIKYKAEHLKYVEALEQKNDLVDRLFEAETKKEELLTVCKKLREKKKLLMQEVETLRHKLDLFENDLADSTKRDERRKV